MMSFFLRVCEEHLSCHRNYGEQNHEFSAAGIFVESASESEKSIGAKVYKWCDRHMQ